MLSVHACYFTEAAGDKIDLSGAWQPPAHTGGESSHVQDGLTKRQNCRGDVQSQEIRSQPEGEQSV